MLCFISVTSVISVRDTIFMEHVGDVLAKTRFEDRGARIKDKGTRIKDKGTRENQNNRPWRVRQLSCGQGYFQMDSVKWRRIESFLVFVNESYAGKDGYILMHVFVVALQ